MEERNDMIQRIQTLYMTVVVVMMWTLFFTSPAALTSVDGNTIIELGLDALPTADNGNEMSTVIMRVYVAIVAVLTMLCIVLYRKRRIQMRISIFTLLLCIGYYVLFGIYIYAAIGMDYLIEWKLPVTFPLVAAILMYLSFRAILHDELLVKSLDRIR